MKPHWLAAIPLILIAMGCANQDRTPAISPVSPDHGIEISLREEPSQVTPLTISRKPDEIEPAVRELQPSPELAVAVRRGEARPAGPITDHAYQRWKSTADLRVRLEGEIGKRTHLLDLLRLAARNEDEFIDRFSLRDVHPGESADRQLRVFQLIRDRLDQEIEVTDQEIGQLQDQLARLDAGKSNTTFTGDHKMAKPLSEIGLSEVQIAKLDRVNIRNSREFALQFYLPEQHAALAELLGIELAEAQQLAREAAKEVPQDELDELVREARQPREIGVLPPDLDKKGD